MRRGGTLMSRHRVVVPAQRAEYTAVQERRIEVIGAPLENDLELCGGSFEMAISLEIDGSLVGAIEPIFGPRLTTRAAVLEISFERLD
jgi:hypothetical protein